MRSGRSDDTVPGGVVPAAVAAVVVGLVSFVLAEHDETSRSAARAAPAHALVRRIDRGAIVVSFRVAPLQRRPSRFPPS